MLNILRLGLVVVLSVTLMRPGQSPASLNGSERPIYFGDDPVCSIDPNWGIELPNIVPDPGWEVRLPGNLDPAFEWHAPCFREEAPPLEDQHSYLPGDDSTVRFRDAYRRSVTGSPSSAFAGARRTRS